METVDILENPSIIDIEKSYVLKKMAEYQDYYGELFTNAKNRKTLGLKISQKIPKAKHEK